MTDDVVTRVERELVPVVDERIRLAGCTVRLVSSLADFPPLRYFSRRARIAPRDRSPVDYELWCVPLRDAPYDEATLASHIDATARARAFATGYYVTEFFGSPMYMLSRGNRYVLFGERFERVVWPYFVKYFLIRHALERGLLHLKAAALALGSLATLVVGRGGSGKTVFLGELCRRGATFVTNSHAIVSGREVEGVASSIRLRDAPWVRELVGDARLTPGLMPGHLIVDPLDLFGEPLAEKFEVANICFVEHGGASRDAIVPLSPSQALDCLEEFGLALNVYRLEEDLLDLFEGDYERFAREYARMKAGLRELVAGSHCYFVTGNMFDARTQEDVLDLLSVAPRQVALHRR